MTTEDAIGAIAADLDGDELKSWTNLCRDEQRYFAEQYESGRESLGRAVKDFKGWCAREMCEACTTRDMAGPIPGTLSNGERCDVCERYASYEEVMEALNNLVGNGAQHEKTCDRAEHDSDSDCIYCEARTAIGRAERGGKRC